MEKIEEVTTVEVSVVPVAVVPVVWVVLLELVDAV